MKILDGRVFFTIDKFRGFWALSLFLLAVAPASRIGGAGTRQPKKKFNPRDGLTYVWIAAGTFQMGCSPDDFECADSEKPAHSVTITKGFWIGQTEVTEAAFKQVVGGNRSSFDGDQLPVENISWDNAQAYCEGIDMRLPTEAEWEYAARGGSSAPRYAPLVRIAWYLASSGARPHEVGQKQPNGYGLYDTLGNVWEWVADWYAPYDGKSEIDPTGPRRAEYRVLRGGSWDVDAASIRVSFRFPGDPLDDDVDYGDVGFRCVGN
jgi:formylglycine-generating enzyme required for sulfatase activity